jgi:hypothetical protein
MNSYGPNNIRSVKILAVAVLLILPIGTFFISKLVLRKMGFSEEASERTLITSFLFLNPFLIGMVLLGFREWIDKKIAKLNPFEKDLSSWRRLLRRRIQTLVFLWLVPICLALIVTNTLRLIPDTILIIASIVSYPLAAGVTMHILHCEMKTSGPSPFDSSPKTPSGLQQGM